MIRDRSIDILRGMGILFVIMGHIEAIPTNLLIYIYSFHMPLFFYISGYLYKEKYKNMSLKEYCKKLAKSLLYPYLTLEIINLIWQIIGKPPLEQILKTILSFIYSNYIFETNYVGAIWFLGCLFSVEVLYFIIDKYFRYKKISLITIFFTGIFLSEIIKLKGVRLPFWIDIALFGIIFYYIGVLTAKFIKKDLLNNKIINILLISIFLFINIMSILLNYKYCYTEKFKGRIDMLYLHFGNYIFFYLAAISGIYMWHLISKIINSNKLLETYGKNTLLIMGIHMIICQISSRILYKIVGQTVNKNIIFIVLFIIISLTSLLGSLFIKKFLPIVIDYSIIQIRKEER